MSDEKRNLRIEDAITERLTDDAQKNALAFVAFLRANNVSFDSGEEGNGEGWAVGGTVGDSIGYMMVNGEEKMPGPWTFWFNACDFGEEPAEDALKESVWAHVSPCGQCHPGWADCGGGERTIWGRRFDCLCHSPLMFTNPDAKTVATVEKLILLSL